MRIMNKSNVCAVESEISQITVIENKPLIRSILEQLPDEVLVQPYSLGSSYYNRKNGYLLFCLDVAESIAACSNDTGFRWDRRDSPVIISFLMDQFKLGKFSYEQDYNPITQDITGFWIHNPNYQSVPDHGKYALDMAKKYGIKLTEQEKRCILYHHPINRTHRPRDLGEYSKMVKDHPEILMVQAVVAMYSQRTKGDVR